MVNLFSKLQQRFVVTGLALFVLLTGTNIYAQTGNRLNPPGTAGYSMYLAGVRSPDSLVSFVYDDYNASGAYHNWNCGNKFLFNSYLNTQLELRFGYNGNNNSGGYNTSHTLQIFFNHGATPIYTTTVADGQSFFYTPTSTGYYDFAYYSNGVNPDLVGEVLVIPNVNRVWAEVPEIDCNYPVGQDLTITIKADPDLSTVMSAATQHLVSQGNGACEEVEDREIDMTFSASFGADVHNSSFSNYIVNTFRYKGFQWNSQTWDMRHFTIRYSDLQPILDGNTPAWIYFTYYDGAGNKTLYIPIIVKNNTGNNAGAFHTPDYTVGANYWATGVQTPNEVWTTQSNPVTRYLTGAATAATFRIQNTLDIPAGTTLTIQDMNIEMGPWGRIIVHESPDGRTPGGYLNLKNTTITAYQGCSGNTGSFWQGITALGNNSYDQVALGPNGYRQGAVNMNNSTISYAREAFRNGDPASLYGHNGGMIFALNSSFYNNEHTASFQSYLNSYQLAGNTYYRAHQSSFRNCDFSADQGVFNGFIFGREIRALDIAGCSFTGPQNAQTMSFSKGIMGNDLGVNVHSYTYYNGLSNPVTVPCSFRNLGTAVTTTQVNPLYASLRVTDAVFENNIVGVMGLNMTAPTVQYNQISVPNNTSNQLIGTGVQIYGGSGYHVSENKINGPGSGQSIGVLVWNTGSANNSIRRNNYTNLGTASLSNYTNRGVTSSGVTGLQVLCNQNSGNTNDIAATGSSPSTDGIASLQGTSVTPAGNTFSHTLGGWDIYNPANQVGAITYYYKLGSALEQPSNSTNNVNSIAIAKEDYCPEDIIPNGTVKPDDPRFGQLNAVVRNIQLSQNTDKGELDLSNLKVYLGQWNDQHADLTLADLMIETGQIAEGSNLYNQIVAKYQLEGQEANEFSNFGRQLIDLRIRQLQNGLQRTQLSGDDISLLENIASQSRMWPRLRAQSWLQQYDGREITNTVLYPGNDQTARKANVAVAIENSVYPNPAKDLLTVQYAATGKEVPVFELTTIDGKIVCSTKLISNNQQVPLQGLAAGTYLYHILEAGKTTMQGKVTKQ